jgi:hypothetical protein
MHRFKLKPVTIYINNMTSLEEAFATPLYPTWEAEFHALEEQKRKHKEHIMEHKLKTAFGIKVSDLMSKYPEKYGRKVITNDGTTHYIHKKTGEEYGYVYGFDDPHWIKKTSDGLIVKEARSKWRQWCYIC